MKNRGHMVRMSDLLRSYNRGTRGRFVIFGWCLAWVCLLCGSKLRIRCCVLLYLDLTWARIGRRTSETTSLSPTWPKTGRRILRPDPKQVGDSPSPTCLGRLMRSLADLLNLFTECCRSKPHRASSKDPTSASSLLALIVSKNPSPRGQHCPLSTANEDPERMNHPILHHHQGCCAASSA